MKRTATRLLVCVGLMLGPASFASESQTAIEQLQQLRASLVEVKKRQDVEGHLSIAKEQKVFLHGSTRSRIEVARAQLQAGHEKDALDEIRALLAMGVTSEALALPVFEPLRPSIDRAMHANEVAIGEAAPVRRLDPGLLSEDIDFDPKTRRFFVSSVLRGQVIALYRDGRQEVFVRSENGWPILGVKIDAKRRILWATLVALDDWTAVPEEDRGKTEVRAYDLDRGVLLDRHAGPTSSRFGDIVLASDGDPLVSDGRGGGIYRVHDGRLARIDHGDFVSPQTIAVCEGTPHVFVPDYVRGVAVFDPRTGSVVRWLPTDDRHALDGIDGLYCRGHSLIAVQNGTRPDRVVVFALDPTFTSIVGEKVIDRHVARDLTHGVVVGEQFHYLTHAGWNSIDDHGVRQAGASIEDALIFRATAP